MSFQSYIFSFLHWWNRAERPNKIFDDHYYLFQLFYLVFRFEKCQHIIVAFAVMYQVWHIFCGLV